MLRNIIAASLGFFTIPMAGLVIYGIVHIGIFIPNFGLPVAPYWAGVVMMIGVAIVAVTVLTIITE